jgi:TRAP-type mannitol/chloroaromatic compound transport system permease small subunit
MPSGSIMSKAEAFCGYVDTFSEWTGRCLSWLVLILTFVIGYDVALRYLFNAPTKWAYELSYQLGGTFFWLGAAYTLRHGAHVRIDIFYGRFSTRTKALIDVILYLLLFFPVWIGMTYYLYPYVMHSWHIREKAMMGFWQPIIYPFKTTMILGTIFLLLQGVAEFIRNIITLSGGEGES